jgi:hypothetical protein
MSFEKSKDRKNQEKCQPEASLRQGPRSLLAPNGTRIKIKRVRAKVHSFILN